MVIVLAHTARTDVHHGRAQDATPVDAVMRAKAPIFHRDE
jgi:hypothetical protein